MPPRFEHDSWSGPTISDFTCVHDRNPSGYGTDVLSCANRVIVAASTPAAHVVTRTRRGLVMAVASVRHLRAGSAGVALHQWIPVREDPARARLPGPDVQVVDA